MCGSTYISITIGMQQQPSEAGKDWADGGQWPVQRARRDKKEQGKEKDNGAPMKYFWACLCRHLLNSKMFISYDALPIG